MNKKTTLLCIIDGFGLNPEAKGNAVQIARKPNFDRLVKEYPSATLITHGEAVGLPAGQMGNSEVGHLNIGAGRIVEQWLLRISNALKGDFLQRSEVYRDFVSAADESPRMHLFGLFSDGGVHSHCDHLYLLLDRLHRDFAGEIVLHVITDGRDTAPNRALPLVKELITRLAKLPRCHIATICGRFYAMDRDKRWERTAKAVHAFALGEGSPHSDPIDAINKSYDRGETDEFIEPVVVQPSPIGPQDSLVFWNFREDRMRQLVRALCVQDFDGFPRSYPLVPKERVLCFTEYDHNFHLPYLFPILNIENHLGEVVSKRGLSQLRVAETEKYPHVTYFFNGGIEKEYPGEVRALVPSPREVRTYDQKPEMSALQVTEKVVAAIQAGSYDLIVVNLANCDMVGHTGDLDAAVRAVETVDRCLGTMIETLTRAGGQALILADHGNAEQMVDYRTGSPHTAHTTFPVPVILCSDRREVTLRTNGTLCDVAPTVLKIMQLEQPPEMTGKPLF